MADRKPFISLYGKPNQIHVSKSVVKLLGKPSHITIYTNDSMSSVAFGVCEAKNVMITYQEIFRYVGIKDIMGLSRL